MSGGRERDAERCVSERGISSVTAEIALKGFEPFRSNLSPGASRHPLPQGEGV
jgi:hypothetical protein